MRKNNKPSAVVLKPTAPSLAAVTRSACHLTPLLTGTTFAAGVRSGRLLLNTRIKDIEDLKKVEHLLPAVAMTDIYKRIHDWISTGGQWSAPYIKRQLFYAEQILNRGGDSWQDLL